MSFSQFLSILRARWVVAMLVLSTVMIVGIGLNMLLPKRYTSAASVVVDFKPDPVTANLYGGAPPMSFMATQVDIILSNRVALKVVRNLKLTENPEIRSQWLEATDGTGTVEQWLSDTFQRSIDVKPSRESSVITVAYSAPDPRFAAALANAFVQAYIETSLELRVDPAKQYSSFFDTRSREAREALERAQSRLSAYQKEKGLIASDERLDVENQRLNELASQLLALQALSAESRARSAQASGQSGTQIQEVINNPLIAGLKADMTRAEARLQEMGSRLGENHPQVREAKANIETLRSRIESESRRVAGGLGLNASVNSKRVADVQAAYDAQRTTVLRMKAVRDEANVLMRDAENAQRAFETINLRLTQTSLESRATQSNVNVLTQATPALQPSSPKVLVNLIIAAVIGTIAALGAALLLELVDRRVRVGRDIVEGLGLTVLGVIPGPARSSGRILKIRQKRVISGRLAGAIKGT